MLNKKKGFQLPSYLYSIPSLLDVEMSTIEDSLNTCNSSLTGGTNCEDWGGCSSQLFDDTEPICCTGYGACSTSGNMTTADSNIRCDAYQSCEHNPNFILTNGMSGGNLYFTGNEAAGRSNSFKTQIQTQWNDVFCTADESCRYRKIKYVNNLYCNAWYACEEAQITSINNVYIYGFGAAYSATKIQDVGNLYCGAYQACWNVQSINNIRGDVYGSGPLALYESNIANVNNSVIGFGYRALRDATVTNATNVKFSYFPVSC